MDIIKIYTSYQSLRGLIKQHVKGGDILDFIFSFHIQLDLFPSKNYLILKK